MKSILSFTDYQKYLAEYFLYRKEKERYFSYRFMAQKTGVDPGLLNNIIYAKIYLSEDKILEFRNIIVEQMKEWPCMTVKIILLILVVMMQVNASWRYLSFADSPLHYTIQDMQTDAQSNIYILASNDTLYRYSKGNWDITSLKSIANNRNMFVQDDGTVWLGTESSGLFKIMGDSIRHFGPNDECIDSSGALPLGMDENGRLISFVGYLFAMGANSDKLMRFSEDNGCQTVPTTLFPGNYLIIAAYSRDSTGTEWFQTGCMTDAYSCKGVSGIYSIRNDSLIQAYSADYWYSVGRIYSDRYATYADCNVGIVVFHEGDTTVIGSIAGREIPAICCFYRDSRNTLWIGTEGYDFDKEKFGLVMISGTDTTIMNKDNSGFNSYFAHRIVESSDGEIWISTHGAFGDSAVIAIYSYDTPVLKYAVYPNVTAKKQTNNSSCFDIRGRVLHQVPSGRQVFIKNRRCVLAGF